LLFGFADGSGALDYLATDFTLNENVNATGGHFKVTRAVELTFAPSGNKWLVTAYRVRAKRTSVVGTTTTTATSGTKP
jgi:hypothetical protein